MERITDKHLEGMIQRHNIITGSPQETWGRDELGGNKSNVGNYLLDYANGGAQLSRMGNERGGITNVLGVGFKTKRETYGLIHAYIRGREDQACDSAVKAKQSTEQN